MATSLEKTKQFLLSNYGRFPICMTKGLGAEIWDEAGKRYIDFFAGFGACGISGHSHPKIVSAVTEQVQQLQCHGNYFTNPQQLALAEKIIGHSFPGKVFFCHSGAEANEAAIKLVRKATGKYKIICFENCFHGRTMGTLSLTPESFQKGFEPMLEGAVRVPFNDLEVVKRNADEQTAAIFVEPIQGEGGVNIPSLEYMQGLRKLCDERGIILVCDEVWTSPARTGAWFAYQHFGITPDVMTLAKALGGGLPIGACVIADKYADVLGPGTHGCTMGGNPVCAAASLATFELVEKENLLEKANELGQHFQDKLNAKKIPTIKSIRGKGLMIGIELSETVNPADIVKKALDKGLFLASGKGNTLRVAPPLVIAKELLDQGIEILASCLK